MPEQSGEPIGHRDVVEVVPCKKGQRQPNNPKIREVTPESTLQTATEEVPLISQKGRNKSPRQRTHGVERRKHGLLDGQVLGESPLGVQVEEGGRHVAGEALVTHHDVRGILVVVHDGQVERTRLRDLPSVHSIDCRAEKLTSTKNEAARVVMNEDLEAAQRYVASRVCVGEFVHARPETWVACVGEWPKHRFVTTLSHLGARRTGLCVLNFGRLQMTMQREHKPRLGEKLPKSARIVEPARPRYHALLLYWRGSLNSAKRKRTYRVNM